MFFLALSLTSHHSIFFTLFVGPIPVTGAAFFFFSSVPKLTEPSKKIKKQRNLEQTEQPTQEKKKNRIANPEKKGKKKSQRSKVAA